jgi:hypothetical protein
MAMNKKLLAIALLLAARIPFTASAKARTYHAPHMRTYKAHIVKIKIRKIKIYHQ